ncbi:unnamed protein product [Brassica oleracea var. botrytis]|uniref:O-methyltransferase domain-containing protein n=2 Tax=Brassica TaxID=3705 RepID=A0A3P6FRX8_BRAOL|nr:unnamed protein product [Brassica napus]VDD48325.1 unnamed protein product [Brassica oleracea]
MANHLQEPLTTYCIQRDEEMMTMQALKIATNLAFPMVFKAALELGVFDTIAAMGNGAWLSSSEIASGLQTKPTNPEAPMDNLKGVIQEGKDAFSSAHGMPLFEYIGLDEQFAGMFNHAMAESSTIIMKKILEVYRGFEDVNTLVDIGGGLGTVLNLVTSKYPQIKGINFDLTMVLANAPSYPGVEHVPGDMFIEVPKGDAILMKRVLHDWTDQDCVKILKNCWKSLPEKGKVIIVDIVTPIEPKNGDVFSNIVFSMDMLMLTQCSGGKERSLSQFEALASASGFLTCEIICLAYAFSVIEMHK